MCKASRMEIRREKGVMEGRETREMEGSREKGRKGFYRSHFPLLPIKAFTVATA